MPTHSPIPTERITEFDRLINLARAILDRPEEDIVANYLDHAVEALKIVTENASAKAASEATCPQITAPAMVVAAGLG